MICMCWITGGLGGNTEGLAGVSVSSHSQGILWGVVNLTSPLSQEVEATMKAVRQSVVSLAC